MKILAAEFVTSVAADGELPASDVPVIAFVGRSNVGKSSLINALAKRRIARAGGTPGTTRLLNVYRVRLSAGAHGTMEVTLVDLPGYGYSRGSEHHRRSFDVLTSQFFAKVVPQSARRPARARAVRLAGVVLVLDIRHPGLGPDTAAQSWLVDRGFPFLVVTTKGDRLSRAGRERACRNHEVAARRPIMAVSSKTGEGIDKLWTALARLVTHKVL